MFIMIINQLIATWNQTNYQPLLEADVAGWLFHFFITAPNAIAQNEEIHLDTRVLNVANSRFDVSIGTLQEPINQRPSIDPRIVIEIKLFPRQGFTNQQHRVHFEHILNDDLRKLAQIPNDNRFRCSLIVDGAAYLNGQYNNQVRSQVLINQRNQIANGVDLLFVRFQNNTWNVEQH